MLSRLLPSLFACALALLLLSSPTVAAPEKKPPSPYAMQIHELHHVKILLEKADHDYKGHRAEAAKQVTAAIHALQAGYAHVKHPGEGGKGGGEPQALSDAQLREAIDKVKKIQTQLSGALADPAAKTAAIALSSAVSELETALTIK
jgi:hypothetical protein